MSIYEKINNNTIYPNELINEENSSITDPIWIFTKQYLHEAICSFTTNNPIR